MDIFNKLDDYSLLVILEKLEYSDLATVASISARSNKLILDYNLLSKFGIKGATLHIEVAGKNQLLEALYRPIGESRTKVLCAGYNRILATLKAFCPAFDQLHLTLNYFHPHEIDSTREIVDHVNRYCATVSQKMMIKYTTASIEEFIMQNTSSIMIHNPEKLTNFSLNKRFPQVERLTILIDKVFVISENLPHLKHFELLDSKCGHFDLKTFGELNPQIDSVKLDLCEELYNLRDVNDIFPDLVSLYYKPIRSVTSEVRRALDDSKESSQSIRFRNIKRYTIDLFHYYYHDYRQDDDAFHADTFARLSSIQFDQLESLEYITVDRFYSNGQMDFVAQYKQVTRLDYSSYGMSYKEIWRLIDALPNLSEIIITPSEDPMFHDDFLQLMMQTNLDTIRVFIDNAMVDAFLSLNLPGQWFLCTDAYILSYYSSGRCLTYTRIQ